MTRRIRSVLIGAVALLALTSAPALAQSDASSDMDMSALTVNVTGVEYAYTGLPTSLPLGTELTFTNGGTELHEMVLLRIGDDVTQSLEELLAMEAQGRDPIAEGLVEFVGGAPLFALPGQTADGSLPLDSEGRYVVICFVPQGMTPERLEAAGVDLSMLDPNADPADLPPEAVALMDELSANPPHVALGMIQEFAVTSADSAPGPLPGAADESMDES